MANPLPELLTLLKHFARDPLYTIIRLMDGYNGVDERVLRVLTEWLFISDGDVETLIAIVNDIFGCCLGDVLKLLPAEIRRKLEDDHRLFHEAIQELANCGYKRECLEKLTGRRLPWLEA